MRPQAGLRADDGRGVGDWRSATSAAPTGAESAPTSTSTGEAHVDAAGDGREWARRTPTAFAALGVGTAMALGILGQVRHGGGNVLHTSMLSTVALALADSNVDDGSGTRSDVDPDLFGLTPSHRLYPTAEGWLMVAALSADERAALAAHTGVDLDDAACMQDLEAFFAGTSSAEHEQQLRAAGVTCAEVVDQPADRHVTLGQMGREPRLGHDRSPRRARRLPAGDRVHHVLPQPVRARARAYPRPTHRGGQGGGCRCSRSVTSTPPPKPADGASRRSSRPERR